MKWLKLPSLNLLSAGRGRDWVKPPTKFSKRESLTEGALEGAAGKQS